MSATTKELVINVEDGTEAALSEEVAIRHLSDLGDSISAVIEDFRRLNDGAVLPPVSIQVTEKEPVGNHPN
jgi:hypothetical protein